MSQRARLAAALVAAALVAFGSAGSASAHHAGADCSRGYYKNVSGHCIHSPSTDPAGATAKCSDNTYSYSEHASGTCSHHGGVARWINHP